MVIILHFEDCDLGDVGLLGFDDNFAGNALASTVFNIAPGPAGVDARLQGHFGHWRIAHQCK